jgi:amino acid transporter
MFDYALTGPISGVSAGHYIAGLVNELLASAASHGWLPPALASFVESAKPLNENFMAMLFAIAMTLFYWWQNVKGLEESSEKSLLVMKITGVMVVILLGWSGLTLLKGNYSLPPLPSPSNLKFSEEALGFLHGGDWHLKFGLLGILMAFGHSVLAMSGEESLAQVNREIVHPKLMNLKRAAIVIGIFSFVFTGICSLLAVMIIPDEVRIPVYKDNLISGLAMHMYGPTALKLVFRVFVVVVGFLMLTGAINTSIIGSNGVMNRISEDGVLTDWFRKPHRKFGTTSRIINLIVVLQIITIIASQGDVYVLGEAYAFGVIWSFTFNGFSMLVLRYKHKGQRGWKVPPNFTIAGREVPLGLASVFMVLLSTAVINLFTKSVATVAGLIFAGVFFLVLTVSERINQRKQAAMGGQMKEHFQLQHEEIVSQDTVGIRPGNVLVTVRDYNAMHHLKWVLERTDTEEQDVVVMAARMVTGPGSEQDIAVDQVFSDYEQTLFTRAVSVAEGYGKKVSLLVVPARDVWSAIVQTANQLGSSAVVAGLSTKMTPQMQGFNLGRAWEAISGPKKQFVLQIVKPEMTVDTFRIGPHTPDLKTEDIHLVHRLWLDATREPGLEKLHHSDIVTEALTRFVRDYNGPNREEILKNLKRKCK